MNSPLPSRSRLSRSSLSTPNRNLTSSGSFSNNGTLLPKSPSTPYDIYHTRNRSPLAPPQSSPRSTSAFVTPNASQQVTSFAAYRRNAGFGSPGSGRSPRQSLAVGTSTDGANQKSNGALSKVATSRPPRYIRRKPLKQKLQDLPSAIFDWILFSPLFDFGDPAIGYPTGILLHVISLLAIVLHPDGTLHLSLPGKRGSSRSKGLFQDQGNIGGLAYKRRQAQENAWRSFATLLIYVIFVLALANAYHLFTTKRRYYLWMKSTSEDISSENASLVDLPHAMDEEPKMDIHDYIIRAAKRAGTGIVKLFFWLLDRAFDQLRQIPYAGVIFRFLFPPTLSRRLRQEPLVSPANKMHAIDMWTASEVHLRILCLYSPLHATFYMFHLSSQTLKHFIMIFSLMVLASAQVTMLVHFYSNLIKDKNIIAGEVLHEYDEKFVKPRAMTVSRDASTMTDEAELQAAKRQSWIHRSRSSDEEGGEDNRGTLPSASRSRRDKGRKSTYL